MHVTLRIASVMLLAAPLTGVAPEFPHQAPVPNLRLQWQDPGSLRFDEFWAMPSSESRALMASRYQPAVSGFQTPSPIKLFDSRSLTAQWSADGRLTYRLAVPNPLGAGVGGQLNTNSARFTLTWPRKK